MADKKIIALMPTYYKNFNCIGPACEDTCCRDWGAIHVDKSNYMKIKHARIEDKVLADRIKNLYSRIKHDVNEPDWKKDSQYAVIELDPITGRCPLVTEQGLCSIHATLGPKYLSNTCQKFPRMSTMFNKNAECGLTVACPEAARVVLFNKDGINFEYSEIERAEALLASNTFNLIDEKIAKTFKKHFFIVRNTMIDILQNRKYSLDDRMIILGIVLKKINELSESEQIDEIPNAVLKFDKLIEQGAFDEGLKEIKANDAIKAPAIRRIASVFHNSRNDFEAVKIMRKTIEDGYKMKNSDLDNWEFMAKELNTKNDQHMAFEKELNDRYNLGYNELFKPFLAENEYIFENFIVNEAFSKVMPFIDYNNIWDVYMRLCAVYAYVKFVFIGVMFICEKPDKQKIVDTFVAIEKSFSYNVYICKQVVTGLHNVSFDELATMTILVKN